MLTFANKLGNVFSHGLSTFNSRIAPGIGQTIREAAKIGRSIREVSKVGRQIGQSANAISGGRLMLSGLWGMW